MSDTNVAIKLWKYSSTSKRVGINVPSSMTTPPNAFTVNGSIATIGTAGDGAVFQMRFSDRNNNLYTSVYGISSNYGGRLRLRQYSGTENGLTGGSERYSLPNCDQGLTDVQDYAILTSKTAVTIAQGGTGASEAGEANNNLQSWSLGPGTAIATGADLNTYKTVGNYTCGATATARTVLNTPYGAAASDDMAAFVLKVCYATGANAQYIKQELNIYNTNQNWIRYSTNTGDNWSSWVVRTYKSGTAAVGSTNIPVYSTGAGALATCSGVVVTAESQSFEGYKTFLAGATAGSPSATGSRYFVASSNSGTIDLLSVGNADGNGARGIWVDAHGTGSDKWALRVDTNNNVSLPSETTCSGTFTALASINTIGTSTNGAVYAMRFSDKDDSIYGQVYTARSANNGGRIRITQFSENSSGELSGGRERYSFPVCEQGLTETVDYIIYTSKNRADIFKTQPTLNYGTQYTTIKFNPSISVDSEYYGLFGIDVGSTTTPTRSRFYFQEASVSTADGVTTGYNELYYLPTCSNNRTTSAAYTILTTKDYDFTGVKKVEISASGSVTLTMSGSARALVISNGGNANQRGAYILYQNGSVKTIVSASALTTSYTGSTATFTSTATTVTYLDIIIFNGSIT